jgi:uncharacterized protein
MDDVEKINVEVAYALPNEQVIISLAVSNNATLEEAIRQSGILQTYPDINLDVNKVGIFGKLSRLDTPLKSGDRVEIYRMLIADPKEVRRKRAAEGKAMKKGQGKATQSDHS